MPVIHQVPKLRNPTHHPANNTLTAPPKPTNTLRPYFLGFGLLPAVAASLLPFFVGVGAYAMVFPLVRNACLADPTHLLDPILFICGTRLFLNPNTFPVT